MLRKRSDQGKSNLWEKIRRLAKAVYVVVKAIIGVVKYIEAKLQTENGKRITHWLFFSVILCLLPLFFAVSQDRMSVNYTFEEIKVKYATDFILTVFAVAVNVCGCTVLGKVRMDGLVISIVSMLYCMSKYTHLHNPKTVILPGVINNLLLCVLFILVLNAGFGIALQVASTCDIENSSDV